MTSRDLFELEPGDTGESLLARLPGPPAHVVHNHDLDPTCRETRNQLGKLVGECLKVRTRWGAHSDRDGSEEPRGGSTPVEANKVSDRGARLASGEPLTQVRHEWGVMFADGSVRAHFNGRTARLRAESEALHLATLYAPDDIHLVSRPVYVGDWT